MDNVPVIMKAEPLANFKNILKVFITTKVYGRSYNFSFYHQLIFKTH